MLTTLYFAKNDHRWVTFIILKTIDDGRPRTEIRGTLMMPADAEVCRGLARAHQRQGLAPRSRDTAAKSRESSKLYWPQARSRLYRSQILQVLVNTLWKALAEIYKMHSFAPL